MVACCFRKDTVIGAEKSSITQQIIRNENGQISDGNCKRKTQDIFMCFREFAIAWS